MTVHRIIKYIDAEHAQVRAHVLKIDGSFDTEVWNIMAGDRIALESKRKPGSTYIDLVTVTRLGKSVDRIVIPSGDEFEVSYAHYPLNLDAWSSIYGDLVLT